MRFNQPDFKKLFESAPGLYLVLSPSSDYSIIAVSNNYLKATMTKRDEILGHGLFDVFPDNPEDPSASGTSNLRASLERVLKHQISDTMAVQKYDIKRPASEGGGFEERFWSPINFPVFNEEKCIQYIIHRVEDVTDFVKLKQDRLHQHKETEKLRSRADHLEKLRQSQRMEAMGQLAGGIAHDFNNILAIIMLTCETPPGVILDDGLQKRFETIKNTSAKAAMLTRQLLAFSRKQVLVPQSQNLNAIVANLENLLNRLLPEDIKIRSNLAADLGNALVDSVQIEQIILNLVVNARDAMPNGGTITLETKNAILDESLASGTPKVEPGRYIMIAISDSGIGMTAETQARLFEPFFTTKSLNKGTGLGLATVHGIVSQSKGTIWVYSEPLKGTVFKIYFPRTDEPVQQAKPLLEDPTSLRGTESILIVEDQEEIRSIMVDTLKQYGYKVREAVNGTEALSIFKESPMEFDLVITDVVMPEMGGRALAKNLSKLSKNIKVLYLSGYTEETLVNYGVSAEHPQFLEKPFTTQALLNKIRAVLQKSPN